MRPTRASGRPALKATANNLHRICIKGILLSNANWWQFYAKYHHNIRLSIVIAIVKLLSCKHKIRGYHTYRCTNPDCTHLKRVPHTCKSKACSSCGKKATELWLNKQYQILPNTTWQHITFTLPSELWDFFWCNRQLLNLIGKIAASTVKTIAQNKGVTPGIFIAIHTFGRDLKRNVHIHLSTTTGGLTNNNQQWKNVFFKQKTLMTMWRYQIIRLFRQLNRASKLNMPPNIKKQLNHTCTFNQILDQLYQKSWIVHCAKPSPDHQKNVTYLARYIKRPPIAESKLRHYDGTEVTFNYLDHTSKTYRRFKLSATQFIARFIQHIPDYYFRMIRYYGFLANRVRGKLLPIVYQLLQQDSPTTAKPPTYADLIQKDFNFDPLACIICGQKLLLTAVSFGKASTLDLLHHHQELACLKKP